LQLKSKLKRATSAFLAFVLVLGMLPGGIVPVSAASNGAPADTITMDYSSQSWGAKYKSDVLGDVILHNFVLNVNGEEVPGWCNDHSKPACYTDAGYSNPVKYESNLVSTPFLDFYVTQYERNEAIRQASGLTDDTAIKNWLSAGNGEPYGWGGAEAHYWYYDKWEWLVTNATVQSAVWLYASGKLTDSSPTDEIITLIGTECHNGLVAQGYTANSLESCIETTRSNYNLWLNNIEFNHYEYYVYSPNSNASTVQTILIPKMTPKDYSGYIKLKKTDGTGQPLAGAVFGIYTEKECIHKIDSFTTTTDEWNYSAKINLDTKTQELWVKEINAPPGYVRNAKPWPVTVDSTVNNTKDTAAAVNSGNAIKNTPPPSGGVICKVDMNGNPIGPATFNFYSIEQKTDRTITTDANGVINLQWVEKDEDNYIAPGEYRVTETIAPPGFVLSHESQNIKFWVEWDDEGLPVQLNSGPLTFKNEQMRKVKVMKVDGSGDPLSGAAFDIYKDGTKIGSATTGHDGSFTYAGADGNGLESGYYEFVETSAPGGFLLPTDNTLSVTIDTSDSSQPETVTVGPLVNYEHPEIRIRKLINGTTTGLAGAVFQVRIDGKMLDETFTSDDDGYVAITYAQYGKYLDDTQDEWVIEVRETVAPDGYLIDDGEWHQLVMHKGETLKEFVFTDTKYPEIRIRKLINGTETGLAGAVFQVRIDGKLLDETFTSDDNGYIVITHAQYGKYLDGAKDEWVIEVRETVAPDGYLIDDDEWHELVMRKGEDLKEFVFTDTEYPEIEIMKIDRESGKGLANTTFSVTIDGNGPLSGKTDENGIWKITYDEYARFLNENNEVHTVTVTEVTMPDGYNKDLQESGDYTLTQSFGNGQKLTKFTFKDTVYRIIKVYKTDSEFGDPLKDAYFVLESVTLDNGGSYRKVVRTGADGYANFGGVPNGVFHLWESTSPEGYEIVNDDVRTVVVTSGDAKEIVFDYSNAEQKSIRVYKTDSVSGEPIEGVRFTVYDADGKIVQHIFTDSTGWASTTALPSGEYTLIESSTPDSYVSDDTPHVVTVIAGEVARLDVQNVPKTALHIWKNAIGDSDRYLGGAVFEVKRTCGIEPCVIVGEYETDFNGLAVTEPLAPGDYIVTEKVAPKGFALDETEHTVCVKAGQYNEITISDQELATLVVRKIDSATGKPIAGAVFKLENADTYDLAGMQESDTSGDAVFYGLKEGFYIVTETQSPEGFTLSDPNQKIIHVEYGKNNYVDFTNPAKGQLVVVLQDKHTSEYLADGEFRVTRESDQVVVYDGRTDVTGTIVIGDLLPSWYTVEQIYAPDGYTMIDTVKKIEVLSGEQVHVYFEDETARMIIEKVDATDPSVMLEGARFKVTRDADNIVIGEYVTDKSGMVSIELIPGLYHVQEITAPHAYSIDNKDPMLVHVKGGETAHVTFADTPLAGITVNVVDEANKPVAGAVVEIWRQNGELVNSFTTDTTGAIQSDKLDAGYYVIKLISFPDGYTAETTEYTVEIKDGVTVTRTFKLTSGGTLQVLSTDSSGKAVAGMRFIVTTIDGSKVGEYTTDKSGSMVLPNIEPSWLVVTETKAPDGYTLSATAEQKVEIKAGKSVTVTFRHDKIYGLQISTVCKQTGTAVEGAVYRIAELSGAIVGTYTSRSGGLVFEALKPGYYQVTPVSVPDGYTIVDSSTRVIQVLANGVTKTEFVVEQMSSVRVQIVDGSTGRGIYGVRLLVKDGSSAIRELISNNEGYIELTNDIINKSYILEMISAPGEYTIDTVPKSINALVGETTTVKWAIYQNAGQIQVVVTSSDYNKTRDLAAGTALQGAVIKIMNADTYQVVGTMISDASGVAASSGLPIGRYIVSMVTAPAYYALSDEEIEVRLKINNDVVRTDMQVKSVNLAVDVEQKSNLTIRAGSSMRVDILKADNNSDMRLDNFNLHIKVPTDCARIGTLYAGTWNQAVWYNISYKTNMQDYRVLASNLQSTTAYQYDLSTAALGLQSGEYVTDVRFEFGTVPAGFSMNTKSAISLYVLSTVTNGYKLINRIELSGQYNTTTVSTTHIDNNWPYSASGSYDVSGGASGATGSTTSSGTGTPTISSNSGQWTTDTSTWTATVTNSTNIPGSLPKTGY